MWYFILGFVVGCLLGPGLWSFINEIRVERKKEQANDKALRDEYSQSKDRPRL